MCARPGKEVEADIRDIRLCGSDLATSSGLNPLVSLLRIPGHQTGAVILSCWPGVLGTYAPAQRVIVAPYTACATCSPCLQGRVNACRFNRTLGVQQDGGLSERLVLPCGKQILNDTPAPRHLALVKPLSVGFHAAARGRVTAQDCVVVLGSDPALSGCPPRKGAKDHHRASSAMKFDRVRVAEDRFSASRVTG